MKCYLAGPMTGYEDLNIPLFLYVSKKLRAAGYEVFCPGDLSLATFGSLENLKNHSDDDLVELRKHQLSIELAWICRFAQRLYLLPGWEQSSGAKAEKATAEAIGIDVRTVPEHMLPTVDFTR